MRYSVIKSSDLDACRAVAVGSARPILIFQVERDGLALLVISLHYI